MLETTNIVSVAFISNNLTSHKGKFYIKRECNTLGQKLITLTNANCGLLMLHNIHVG